MGKQTKRKSISLTFTIVREGGRDNPSYMIETASADGRATYRAVRPAWNRDSSAIPITAHDAIAMAQEDLWAAIMGANL